MREETGGTIVRRGVQEPAAGIGCRSRHGVWDIKESARVRGQVQLRRYGGILHQCQRVGLARGVPPVLSQDPSTTERTISLLEEERRSQ